MGLGRDASANTSYAIDYAFSFGATGVFEVREAGVYRAEGSFGASDVFKVTVTSGTVKYYRNATLLYTSRVAATSPLVADTSLESLGAGVTTATIVK